MFRDKYKKLYLDLKDKNKRLNDTLDHVGLENTALIEDNKNLRSQLGKSENKPLKINLKLID